jgi:putative membrane protein
MKLDDVVAAVHVIANVFWIGSIVGVGVILTANGIGDAKTRGALGKALYMKVAVPGFVLSFLLGLMKLAAFGDAGFYMKSGWFHIKLTMALVVIALHHVIGGKAKKMSEGDVDGPGKIGLVTAILAVCAGLAVFFVSTRFPGG